MEFRDRYFKRWPGKYICATGPYIYNWIYYMSRSLSVLLMLCPAQSERYFCSVPLNTAVSFEMKRNESIFDPIHH